MTPPDETTSAERASDEDRPTEEAAPRNDDRPDREAPPPPPGIAPFVAAGLVLLGLVAYGGFGHWQEESARAATRQRTMDFVPVVRTAVAKRDDAPIRLTVPGSTLPYLTASLYARATGYVAERRVDIGMRVKQGDVLLRISAPDLDQQLAQAQAQLGQLQALVLQARATLEQAKASFDLARTTSQRIGTLASRGVIAQQNADTTSTDLQTATANVDAANAGIKVAEANQKAQEAAVDRLRALVAFETVTAPFDGVITARNAEVGDFVSADTATGTPLFTMDRDDVLRVNASIPQNVAAGVREGVEATMRVPQLPGREFEGRVARSSVSLLSSARALTVQIDVPNPDKVLRPGLFVDMTLDIPRTHPAVAIPAEALVFDQENTRVAAVGADGTVKMLPVTIERDVGTTLELRDGLKGDETVVVSPPPGLRDGGKVKVAPPPEPHDDKPPETAAR